MKYYLYSEIISFLHVCGLQVDNALILYYYFLKRIVVFWVGIIVSTEKWIHEILYGNNTNAFL